MKKLASGISIALVSVFLLMGTDECNSSDTKQRDAQEKILLEANAQTGMPAIKNFRERKLLKDILELRDQDGLTQVQILASAPKTIMPR